MLHSCLSVSVFERTDEAVSEVEIVRLSRHHDEEMCVLLDSGLRFSDIWPRPLVFLLDISHNFISQ